jgi:hypothetical protein
VNIKPKRKEKNRKTGQISQKKARTVHCSLRGDNDTFCGETTSDSNMNSDNEGNGEKQKDFQA